MNKIWNLTSRLLIVLVMSASTMLYLPALAHGQAATTSSAVDAANKDTTTQGARSLSNTAPDSPDGAALEASNNAAVTESVTATTDSHPAAVLAGEATAAAAESPLANTNYVPAISGTDAEGSNSNTVTATVPLKLEDAIKKGLAMDPGVLSAALDAQASLARAADSGLRQLPSFVVSGGYSKFSPAPGGSLGATPPEYAALIKALAEAFTSGPTDSKDVRVDLQFPIFAGFRLSEATALAKVTALGKDASAELSRRTLVFEITRAYWDAVKADTNAKVSMSAWELEIANQIDLEAEFGQGLVTKTDLLVENAKLDQANIAYNDAKNMSMLASIKLGMLVGDVTAKTGFVPVEYAFATEVPTVITPEPASEKDLLAKALASRSEIKAASAGLRAAEHALGIASADLYPTLLLTGSASYADPDQRAFPPSDKFSFGWSIGARLRYDLGAIPSVVARREAASLDIAKAKADFDKLNNLIAMDVQSCMRNLATAQNSLELTLSLVTAAQEAQNAAQQRYDLGVIKKADLMASKLGLMRARLALKVREISVAQARADLDRAIGVAAPQ